MAKKKSLPKNKGSIEELIEFVDKNMTYIILVVMMIFALLLLCFNI